MLVAPVAPSSANHYDLALIGAGGAGMCLLQAWHEAGILAQKRVLVLEPAEKKLNDRTWCFWAKADDSILAAFGNLIGSSWGTALVAGKQQDLAPYRYYQIRSSALYAAVQALLPQYPQLNWVQAAVSEVHETTDACAIDSAAGQFTAKLVFDSRLPSDAFAKDGLWQSFYGMRIRLEQAAFAPGSMELMNFEVDQQGSTQFVYVLPVSETEGLVELTRFDGSILDRDEAYALLEPWARERFGAFNMLELEGGRIPMQMQLNPAAPFHPANQRHVAIGTAAGAVKASTGYAFKQMWAHAEAISMAMRVAGPLPRPYHPPRHSFYDGLLLDILKRHPAKGKGIFLALFNKVPLPQVFRFLDEQSSLNQELPILAALPVPTFLAAVGRKYIGADGLVLLLLLLCVLLQQLWPAANAVVLPVLLGIGLLFPGIPHGAVDHLLDFKNSALPLFVGKYVAIMLAVVLLWWQWPTLALLGFIGYSAWHFGQTDAKVWGQKQPWWAITYGVTALGFILLSHPTELQQHISALGSGLMVPQGPTAALFLGMLLLLLPVFLPKKHRIGYGVTALVVLGGALLPLLPAFGFYFIGLHSWRGWRHLQQGLGMSHADLFKKALPFSTAAWLLFIGLGIAAATFDLSFEGWIPAFFVFLAAVSAPHIVMMHRFYGRSSAKY
ncbi:MAG: beta-carotene 15,15'-dioxygenase, Brp/Blh family [Sphingobacteriaceae bacterium]|nr:beta-carotene 15,15'-dioxygenase, Brp/Blh family [Sphingobacteriaceae bacterium]